MLLVHARANFTHSVRTKMEIVTRYPKWKWTFFIFSAFVSTFLCSAPWTRCHRSVFSVYEKLKLCLYFIQYEHFINVLWKTTFSNYISELKENMEFFFSSFSFYPLSRTQAINSGAHCTCIWNKFLWEKRWQTVCKNNQIGSLTSLLGLQYHSIRRCNSWTNWK